MSAAQSARSRQRMWRQRGFLVRPLVQSRLICPVRFIECEVKVDFFARFFRQRVSIRRVTRGKTVGLRNQRGNPVVVYENSTEVLVCLCVWDEDSFLRSTPTAFDHTFGVGLVTDWRERFRETSP